MNISAASVIRSFIWRLGRRLYCWARRDGDNDPEKNGEYWLLEVLITQNIGGPPTLMDIGANLGNWSEKARLYLEEASLEGRIHAFEPTSSTFSHLSTRFAGSAVVSTNKIAISDRSGEMPFYVVGELKGTNSLLYAEGATTEYVAIQSLDEYLENQQLEQILLVKSDTEGHDFTVLRGGEKALRRGQIDVWQFEYNHRWADGRTVLKDVFEFIADKPYSLGKLYGNGIELFDQWHPELERFFEANYVLIRNGNPWLRHCRRMHFNKSNVLIPLGT